LECLRRRRIQRQEGDDGYHRGQCCQAAKAIPTAVILPFHRRDLLLEGNGIFFGRSTRGMHPGCRQELQANAEYTIIIGVQSTTGPAFPAVCEQILPASDIALSGYDLQSHTASL